MRISKLKYRLCLAVALMLYYDKSRSILFLNFNDFPQVSLNPEGLGAKSSLDAVKFYLTFPT